MNTKEEAGVWVPEARSIPNFTILSEDGLFSLIGIKTPGLTCAAPLGAHVAGLVSAYLGGPGRNPRFDPTRRGIRPVRAMDEARRAAAVARDPDYGEIVCHCRQVSRGEIKEAIRRGATTLDGVKRRTGAGMGRCQGARCLLPVLETLAAETGIKIGDVTKDGAGSDLVTAYGEL